MNTTPKRKKLTPDELHQIKCILVKAQQFELAARVREQEPRKKQTLSRPVDNVLAIIRLVQFMDDDSLQKLKDITDKIPPIRQSVETNEVSKSPIKD